MLKSFLAAATALAMTASLAFGQSLPLTNETSAQPTTLGNRIEGPSGTAVEAEFPTRNDDVPKTIQFARPVTETASR